MDGYLNCYYFYTLGILKIDILLIDILFYFDFLHFDIY